MATATTVLHIQGRGPDEIEAALEAIFTREERPRALRLQGTYSAVLERALDEALDAGYRYLLLRPHEGSTWTVLLELGNRTEGLDRALSAELGGAAVVATFAYGNAVSGYRVVRGGAEVDRYLSDPEYLASLMAQEMDQEEGEEAAPAAVTAETLAPADVQAVRGHPERFAELLPAGTTAQDFAQVVLAPGWWEEQAPSGAGAVAEDDEEEELVDEADRMRCIGLALELWAPSEYPFAGELEEIANKEVGPAVALAFA